MSDDRRVQGHCPECGSQSLFLGSGGHITCGVLGCKDPCAADRLLSEKEIDHIVVFGPEGFDILHPLRERIHGEPFHCGLHTYCSELDGALVQAGRYRAFRDGDSWRLWLVHVGIESGSKS